MANNGSKYQFNLYYSDLSSLDFGIPHVFQITVVATDYGTPSMSCDIKVTIDVADENDHIPIITSKENITVKVAHDTPVNTSVYEVVAFDPDQNDNGKLGYFIQAGKKNIP